MACKFCQIDEYLAKKVQTSPELRADCEHCKAPIASPAEGKNLCELCGALRDIVKENGWLFRAHFQWEQENYRLARRKRELLGLGGPSPL